MSTRHGHPPHALGAWGESLAASALARRGWRILARNYRFGRREIDLVVRRDDVVAFVEVKTRSGEGFGPPEAAVTAAKRRDVEAVALDFLRRRGLEDVDVRFDVVAILVRGERRLVRLTHVADAWRPPAR